MIQTLLKQVTELLKKLIKDRKKKKIFTESVVMAKRQQYSHSLQL